MEAIFEILLQFIFEVVLEVVAQILVELGFESLASPLRNESERNPILATVGYVLFGLILGGLSLVLFPEPIIKNSLLKILNFAVSPILVGFSLCLFSYIWKRNTLGENFFKLEKFVFGFVFALSYSLIRFIFTN
jgi:hypothetical protein